MESNDAQGDPEELRAAYEGVSNGRQVFIPKDLACPHYVGARCIGTKCALWITHTKRCAHVENARATAYVASYLQDLHKDMAELNGRLGDIWDRMGLGEA